MPPADRIGRREAFCVMAAAMLLTLMLLSCSGRKKEYVIAMSQCSEDIWRDKLNAEMRSGTYLYDNVKLKLVSANDDSRLQMKQIDGFTDEGVDMLIVAPNQASSVTPAVERAYDKGIPVILFDRKTSSDKYTAFIGADNVKMGRTMGEYVAARLRGKGRVVEITGLKGSSPAVERHRGFVEALSRHPGIRLVAVRAGNWLQRSGEEAMEKLLDEGVDGIDYVFAHNDRMALGARNAAKAHGLDKRIKFIGIDALPGKGGGIMLVRDGVLDASYTYPTRGDLVLGLAMNILEGRPYKRDNLMKAALVTKDNAEITLIQAEEAARQEARLEKMQERANLYFTQYSHQKVYLALFAVIMVLLVVAFTAMYRAIVLKRRMAEEAADAKLRFFTNVSHEFRTPLTLIADPVNRLLASPDLAPRQRKMLLVVKNNTDIMLRLIGEILDFRKVQNGKMSFNPSRFDLAKDTAQWVEGFRPLAESKGIGLETDVPAGLVVEADEAKVERICYNLVGNAMKYNRRGGGVKVSLRQEGDRAVLSVADTGIGIPRDKAQRVFDRFFQVNAESAGGTGIGLALVKAFAELHGGSVTLDSREGEGSVFTVSLPLRQKSMTEGQANASAQEAEAAPTIVEDTSGIDMMSGGDGGDERGTVLVVDDNQDVREYIASLLAGKYDVRCAADGREGLDLCVKTVPDIVVCDVMMPVMDGLEMCRRLKRETATSHIPVVLLTARTMDEQRTEGYDCGADAYITKPFSGDVLLSRVRNLLESRRRLREKWAGQAYEGELKSADPDVQFMSDFRRIVQQNLSDTALSVEAVAAGVGLSRVQLYRKVKNLTGSTPVEIIRITRLKQAERLLKGTMKTVSEISYEVGFSSPSYFSKCFKDYFGHLPNEAREVV